MAVISVEHSLSHAGLNNQKLVFLGLCLIAKERSLPISFPSKVVDINPSDINSSSYLNFDDVFDLEMLKEFLSRWGLCLSEGDNASEFVPWKKCFIKGANNIKHIAGESGYSMFIRDFVCSISCSQHIKCLAKDFFNDVGLKFAAIQLRIEKDWQQHMARKKYMEKSDSHFFSAEEIFEKVANHGDNDFKERVLAFCNISDLTCTPKMLENTAKNEFGIDVFFREPITDYSGSIKNAALDFELGLQASAYLGLSQSTFSNMLCLTSAALSDFSMHPNHYIYNTTKLFIEKRKDYGIHSSAIDVVGF